MRVQQRQHEGVNVLNMNNTKEMVGQLLFLGGNNKRKVKMVPTVNGLPVLLPAHEHSKFGDPGIHYHIDYRYKEGPPKQSNVIFSDEDIIYKDLPQIRETYQVEMEALDVLIWLSGEHEKLICGRCPHKGLPVHPIGNGLHQCTGHGLVFKDNDVVKDFWLRVGDERLEAMFQSGSYEFNMRKDGESNGAIVETECGKQVSSLPFTQILRWRSGDYLNLKVN
jgi:hypothetical protein